MKTVQMSFDEPFPKAEPRHEAAFEAQRQHLAGYASNPTVPGEFDIWECEQEWGAA